MSILTVTLAVHLLAASPPESNGDFIPRHETISPAKLRAAVHSALKREAQANGPVRVAMAKELVALYQQIGLNQQLAPGPRQQMQGLVGGRLNRAAKNDDYGPELVELIERTIAPGSWESQGGLGRIYYWRNGRALVISQTQDTHERLVDLVRQLHHAGN